MRRPSRHARGCSRCWANSSGRPAAAVCSRPLSSQIRGERRPASQPRRGSTGVRAPLPAAPSGPIWSTPPRPARRLLRNRPADARRRRGMRDRPRDHRRPGPALAGATSRTAGRRLSAGPRRRPVLRLRVLGHHPALTAPGRRTAGGVEHGHPAGRDRRPDWHHGPDRRRGHRDRRGARALRRCPARHAAPLAAARPLGGALVSGLRRMPGHRCAGRCPARARRAVAARFAARRARRAQPGGLAGDGDRRHAAHVLPVADRDPSALPAPAGPDLRAVAARRRRPGARSRLRGQRRDRRRMARARRPPRRCWRSTSARR